MNPWIQRLILFCSLILVLVMGGFSLSNPLASTTSLYQHRLFPSSDGIGKIYMGREIAQVMGHEAAYWLERSERVWTERPQQLITSLDLQPSDVVADIGAGTGYFSFRISSVVPKGKVLAVDLQPEMISILQERVDQDQISNVEPILGSETDPHLPPNSVDLALMVDAYHEFAYPAEMMTQIVQALKPKGRVVLVEYRGENLLLPIKRLHKMSKRQVHREMAAAGLIESEALEILPQQHILIFELAPEPTEK